ncbi:hypothetical protein I317_04071 [Kwoniella heveanensis CBS 569]|nr:hypothetical protein I317_04071 [Kwoniella heveanensis CBS 569]
MAPASASTPDLSNSILLLHHPSVDPSDFIKRLTGTVVGADEQQQQQVQTHEESELEPRWIIDNKYYTADVSFSVHSLGRSTAENIVLRYREADVILYLFEQVPTALPSTLVKLLSTPRDIALAIHVLPLPPTANVDTDAADYEGDAADMFEEIGMEYVDEVHPLTEEDDERPLEPLEIVRQTLMTHLWPNMIRKPLGRGTHSNSSSFPISDTSSLPPSSASASPLGSPSKSQFPITFSREGMAGAFISQPMPSDPAFAFVAQRDGMEGLPEGVATFPALHELRAAIHAEEFDDIDRLDRIDDGFGPGQEEYARLDDWLDEDDEEFEPDFGSEEANDVKFEEHGKDAPKEKGADNDAHHGESRPVDKNKPGRDTNPRHSADDKGDWLDSDDVKFDPIPSDLPSDLVGLTTTTSTTASPSIIEGEEDDADPGGLAVARDGITEGFEDDFDEFEFSDFHSAPVPAHGRSSGLFNGLPSLTSGTSSGSSQNRSGGSTLALDPTPLLLHLQNVREELAGIGDRDERRVRAGKEVAQLMASLGMDMDMDMGDGGLGEEDFSDGMGGMI